MKIYLVNNVFETEYAHTEVVGVFSTRAKAEKFVRENQYQYSAWFMKQGETRDALTIEERELDEINTDFDHAY